MDNLHIDSHIAGGRTLWILRFPPQPVKEIKKEFLSRQAKPRVEFLIPTPFDKNEWMVVSSNPNNDWLKSLLHFQDMCSDAKSRCSEQLKENVDNPDEKAKKAVEEIQNFNILIRFFNELMRYFQPPETPPPENDEE